jgi:hypothetical protein
VFTHLAAPAQVSNWPLTDDSGMSAFQPLSRAKRTFRKHCISYEVCKQPKSDLYRDLLPLLNSGRITLPRNDRLVAQIVGLERRVTRAGKDSIDHAPNGHDDLANAVAGAAAATRSKYRYDSSLDWVAGPDYGKSDADAA